MGVITVRLPEEIAEQLRKEVGPRLTVDIPVAGRWLSGAGRRQSYEMADRGILPTIRVSERRRVVPLAALLRMVGFDPLNEEGADLSAPTSASTPTLVPSPKENFNDSKRASA